MPRQGNTQRPHAPNLAKPGTQDRVRLAEAGNPSGPFLLTVRLVMPTRAVGPLGLLEADAFRSQDLRFHT